MTQIDDGASVVYVWDEPDLAAVCHVARHGRLGWALDQPLGRRNADLADHDAQRITAAFTKAGIPAADLAVAAGRPAPPRPTPGLGLAKLTLPVL
jgi:hypothetical protein